MSELAANLLGALARTSLFLASAAILTYLLLRGLRSTSPTVHRVAACFVLLQGLILFRVSIPVPWYETPRVAASLAEPSISETVAPVRPSHGGWSNSAELPRRKTVEPSFPAAAVPSPSEPVSTTLSWSWPIALTVGWLVGVVVFVLAPLRRYVYFVRGFQYSESNCKEWNAEWLALLSERGIDRHIPLCVSQNTGPLLCRLPGGYKLVVPASLWGRLAGPQRLAILRHELAHYERGDIWKSLLVRVMALPHWFNPFARWATQRFDEAAEWACDQEVKHACSDWSTEYAKALLAVGRHADVGPCHCNAVRGRGLSERIHRLLSECAQRDTTITKVAVGVAILGLVAVHAVRLELVAQEVPADVAEAQRESSGQTVVYKSKNRLPEIIESVRINEAVYENIEIVYRKSYHLEPSWLKTQITESRGNSDDSGYIESLDTTVRVVLQKPLFYLKADESGPTAWAGDVLQAYDGAATRVVSQIGDEQQIRVYQERMPDRRALTPHTFLFADLLRFTSLSEDLARTTTEEGEPVEWRFEREETVNGLACVRLRCDALTPLDRGVMWSVVVWLATERNYLPVKREGYRSSFSASRPVDLGVVEELREIAPGTWFPIRVRTTSYDEQSLNTPKAQIRSESQLTVEKVELDPAYDVNFFRNIPFPEGVPVETVGRKDAAGAVAQAEVPRKEKAKWSVMLEDINRDEKDFYTIDHDAAQSFAFMPNGQTLVTAGDHFSATRRAWFGEVNLWNAATGKVLATFEKKGRSYRASRGSLAISPDGKRIAAVGRRQNASNDFSDLVDLWNVTTGEITNTLIGEPGPILFATFSPDGESLAIGRIKGIVEIWNALNGNQIAKFETNSQSIAYTPDGKVMITGGAGISFWDAASGKRRAHVEPIDNVKWFDSLCLSADARVLAASGIREIGGQSRIYLWDIVYPADGPLTVKARYRGKLAGHSDHIYTLAFSPDGRKLASASQDTKVRIWDVPSEREELCLHDHTDFVYCVAFSPDGENLATIGRDSLKFWELTALLQSAKR